MKSFVLLPVIFSLFTIISCSSNEIASNKDVNPESIYFDYQIWGEEGNDSISIMLQYRFGGINGTTLVLDEPAKVELDGQAIKVDSSKMNGAYYEAIRPLKEFTGKHDIVFTDLNNKQYKEEFYFQPLTLKLDLPAEIKRGDLVLEVDGLEPVDYVRVLLSDTSFTSEGINEIDTVKNGQLIINKEGLKKIVSGPVHLELFKETEKPLKNRTKKGGQISITYGLKRDFILQNGAVK